MFLLSELYWWRNPIIIDVNKISLRLMVGGLIEAVTPFLENVGFLSFFFQKHRIIKSYDIVLTENCWWYCKIGSLKTKTVLF